MKEYLGSWYVQYQGVDHGPFVFAEVLSMLSVDGLEGTIHFWREGLSHWLPVRADSLAGNTPALLLRRELIQYERGQMRKAISTAEVKTTAETRRKYPRRGLVASVYGLGVAGKRHYQGVLSDFSARGIGVRLDQTAEWPVGTEFKLEIVPLSLTGLGHFRVSGAIRWTSAAEMGLELSDYAQAEQALAILDLRNIANRLSPDKESAQTLVAA